MDFKFPLPPIRILANPDSPTSSNPYDASDERASSPGSDDSLISSDTACIHPIFINSDLNPKNGSLFSFEEDYPVDRLNPVCMGYFNHFEYEAAMASINAIEAMYLKRSSPSDVDTLSEMSEPTLRHRRSASMLLSR